MLLAAMVAMVLAAAAPALAQQIGGNQGPVAGDDAVQAGDNVQYAAVCQNIIAAFDQYAGAVGVSDADAFSNNENAAAVSEVAQSQGVSVSQVNECLNATTAASPSPPPTSAPSPPPSAPVLPPTGGIVPSSALALGAGALLVAGGLLARRIVR
jgi:hypothetical protein